MKGSFDYRKTMIDHSSDSCIRLEMVEVISDNYCYNRYDSRKMFEMLNGYSFRLLWSQK